VETAVAASAELPSLLDRTFGRDEITVVRHQAADALRTVGLNGDRLQGFVLAVNEVITNVVLHAGGHGRIVLWLTGGSAWCTVTDSGPGIPEHFLSPPEMPQAFEVGGRGIWLAYQLCDEVSVATGPIGTTIGMRIALPGRDQASGLANGASANS
jgi:anti-sigma regulatory factor (Ser/Thr protein kinase)